MNNNIIILVSILLIIVVYFFMVKKNVEKFDEIEKITNKNIDDYTISEDNWLELQLKGGDIKKIVILETIIDGKKKYLSYNTKKCDNNLYLKEKNELEKDYKFCLLQNDDKYILSNLDFNYVIYNKGKIKIINDKCEKMNTYIDFLEKYYNCDLEKENDKILFKINDKYIGLNDNNNIIHTDKNKALKFSIYSLK